MPINIRELFLADSDLIKVDKINYNFDQILANGGGPIGLKGQKGEIGPVGNTGIQGNDGEKGQKGEKGDSAAAGASNWGRIDYGNANNAEILKPIRNDDDNDDPLSIILGDDEYSASGNEDGFNTPSAWLTIFVPNSDITDKYSNYISFLHNNTSILKITSNTSSGNGLDIDTYEISHGSHTNKVDFKINIENSIYLNAPSLIEINSNLTSAIINGDANTIKLDTKGTNGTTSIELGTTLNNNSINVEANGGIFLEAIETIWNTAPTILLSGTETITLTGDLNSFHGIQLDNTSIVEGGTKIRGNVIWNAIDPFFDTVGPSSHRSIFINRDDLLVDQSPVYIQSETDGDADFPGLVVSTAVGKGDFGEPAVNSTVIHNTGVVIDSNSDSTSVEGFRLDGWDSTSGRDHTQFHVHRGVTEIGNRLRFIRRHLNINAAEEGITTATGYTVPSEYMDATYLDITISSSGEISQFPNPSDDIWDLKLPNGIYEGQRLILHITAAPCGDGITPPGPSSDIWPSFGNTGRINVNIKSSSSGNSTQYKKIAAMTVSNLVNDGPKGSEFIVELLWSGRTYSTSYGVPNSVSRTSGWMIMNGIKILNNGTDGEYASFENDLEFT